MAYKRKPYRYKLRYKLLFWSFIAMIVFSIAMIFMSRPSTGTIIKPSLEDEPNSVEPAGTNTLTARHFRLIYDAGLDTISDISSTDRTAREIYRVARSDTFGRRTFVITVKSLPGGLAEESSFKLRRINPDNYRESSETLEGMNFILFEKLDGSEMTAFTDHGDYYAMLAYTLDSPSGNLRDEALKLYRNFSWTD